MGLKISGFQGMIPKLATDKLPPNMAVLARNCDFQRGKLEPIGGLTRIEAIAKAGDIRSIHKLGSTWLAWLNDVDVIRAQSTETRIYFSGDGYPKSTDEDQAISGGVPAEYPSVAYRMGVAPPEAALSIAKSGTPGDLIDSVAYRYTYVSQVAGGYEEESAPSPVTAVSDVYDGETVTLSNFVVPVGSGSNITHFRVYRSVIASNGEGDFYLTPYGRDGNGEPVYDIPIAQTTMDDYDAVTGRIYQGLPIELKTAGAANPPDDLTHLVQFQNGVVGGIAGKQVRISNVFYPYQMPEYYARTLTFDPVACAAFRDMLVVGTVANPTVLAGADPAYLQQVEIPTNQGCKSRWMCPIEEGVVYASPDGLAICDGVSVSMFGDLYTKEQWAAMDPSSLILAYYDGRLLGFLRGTSTGFRFDFRKERFITEFDLGSKVVWNVHQVPEEDKLYLLIEDGGVYYVEEWGGADATFIYKGRWNHGDNPLFSMCRMEGSGSATLSLTVDGVDLPDITLTGEPQWLSSGYWAKEVEYTITGTAEIDALYFADSVEKLYE